MIVIIFSTTSVCLNEMWKHKEKAFMNQNIERTKKTLLKLFQVSVLKIKYFFSKPQIPLFKHGIKASLNCIVKVSDAVLKKLHLSSSLNKTHPVHENLCKERKQQHPHGLKIISLGKNFLFHRHLGPNWVCQRRVCFPCSWVFIRHVLRVDIHGQSISFVSSRRRRRH